MNHYKYMPIEDLLIERERLQNIFSWYVHADRSYNETRETQARKECEASLKAIAEVLEERKQTENQIRDKYREVNR